jgi:glycerol-3-phosphate dehydrogenase (NAD(P)+)
LSGFQRGRFFVLSGPSYAREVSRKIPTAVVLAGSNGVYRESLQRLFTTSYFRVYTSCDVVGVELGGTLKNIIAIACGISDGLGYGDNTKAALISRGLVEILRLGVFLGGQRETFFGLSGLGDLVVTCMGSLSRNRLLGEKIGQGKTLEEAQSEVFMVTEGIKATKATYFLAKEHDIQMPITSEVYKVLFQGKDPLAGVSDLMLRRTKDETEDFLK